MHTTALLLSLISLTAAQTLESTLIANAPAVTPTTAPITGTAQTVAAQDTNAIAAIGSAAVFASPIPQRRDVEALKVEKRDGDCAPQPAGTGPSVHSPDTPQAFLNYPPFKAAAYSAPIPPGYVLNFTNLQASTSSSSYMGYTTLNAYDTQLCAKKCNAITGCQAFNLYFERDPSLDPNAQNCPNPSSVTNIKCVFWGVPISSKTATNSGQYRDQFQVVIAGSNGYNALPSAPSVPGYQPPISWPGAPSCPADPTTQTTTYLGAKFFSFGYASGQIQYFTAQACVAACSAQTAYNLANPPVGKSASVCNQVVSYLLNDASGVPQGVYCAMFTESWDRGYGTVSVAAFGEQSWGVGAAYAYTNATFAGSYNPIKSGGYQGGNCGGWGYGRC